MMIKEMMKASSKGRREMEEFLTRCGKLCSREKFSLWILVFGTRRLLVCRSTPSIALSCHKQQHEQQGNLRLAVEFFEDVIFYSKHLVLFLIMADRIMRCHFNT